MYCKHCGAPIQSGVKFCSVCGGELTEHISASDAIAKSNIASNGFSGQSTAPVKGSKGKIYAIFSLLVGLVLVCILLVFAFRTDPVYDMKSIVFDYYGTEEFGLVVSRSIPEATWTSEKIGKKHYKVTLEGFCPDVAAHIQMTADINYSDDTVYANITSVAMDGEVYDDLLSIGIAMGIIYD